MGHADEVNTSVDTKRVFASERDGEVSIAWDYPGRTLLEVRILRSGEGFAAGPEPTAGQLVVYEDVTGSFRDPGRRATSPATTPCSPANRGVSGIAGRSSCHRRRPT